MTTLRAGLRSDHDAFHAPAGGLRRGVRAVTDPRLRAAALLRLTAAVPRPLAFVPRNALITLHRSDCLLPMELGSGLRLPRPRGIVCGRMVTGADLTLDEDVTFGGSRDDVPPLPVGDGVSVGHGATLLIDGPAVPSGTVVEAGAFVFRALWTPTAIRAAVAPPGAGAAAPAPARHGDPVRRLLLADYRAGADHTPGWRGRGALALRFLTNPSLHACVLVRLATRSGRRGGAVWRAVLRVKHDIQLGRDVRIDGGLDLPHPVGIVFGDGTRIGTNATITHRVHVDGAIADRPGARLGDDVLVYPAARITAGAVVGDGAIVGAQAVVEGAVAPKAIVRGRRPSPPPWR